MKTLRRADIREAWPRVEEGVRKVRVRTRADWKPEDVYAACRMERAFLFLGEDGFVILEPVRSEYSLEEWAHIWVAYSWTQDPDILAAYQPEIDRIAREAGYSRITMESPRLGWLEKLQDLGGWRPVAVSYERVLT